MKIIKKNIKKKNNKKSFPLLLSFVIVGFVIVLALFIFHVSFVNNRSQTLLPFHFSDNAESFTNFKSQNYLSNLDLLPSNYSEVIEKNKIEIDKEKIGELLNYGKTVINLKENSEYFPLISQYLGNGTPILIDDQLLTLIFLSQLDSIRNDYTQSEVLVNLRELDSGINNNIIVNVISPFHQNIVNQIITSLSICRNLETEEMLNFCIDDLLQMDTKNRNFLELVGFDDFTQSLVILELYQKDNLSKEFLKVNTNNLTTNDQKLIEMWESGGFSLSKENPPITKYNGQSVDIKIDVNNLLLDRMIEYLAFLIDESNKYNYHDKELTNLQEYLISLDNSLMARENPDMDLLEELLFSQKYNLTYSNILLTVLEEEGQAKLFLSPILKYLDIIPSINNNNIQTDYDVPPLHFTVGKIRLPILMYHHIGISDREETSGLFVSPEIFEKQIAYLVKKNYKIINTSELYSILTSGEQPTQKTVMITFDDSTRTHYDVAYPILKKYKVPGVFFIIATRSHLSVSEIKEMSDNGMDIQSHSSTHVDFSKIPDERVLSEVESSKRMLEGVTEKPVTSIAYPGCIAKGNTFGIVASSGYHLGFSCGKYIDISIRNRLSLSRVHVFNDMKSFVKMLSVGL